MGVASPLQSSKPLEYWLNGLKTDELVQLWDFLAGNQHENYVLDSDVLARNDIPTAEEVRKSVYSQSMPSSFYVRKDRGDPPSCARQQ